MRFSNFDEFNLYQNHTKNLAFAISGVGSAVGIFVGTAVGDGVGTGDGDRVAVECSYLEKG